MRNHFLLASLLLILAGCTMSTPNEIVVCGNDKVQIINTDLSDGKDLHVVWEWKVSEAEDQLPPEYMKYMDTLDECKPYDKGKRLLLTSSSGGVIVLDRASRSCIFYAHVPMAHSAEILPGGRIAVALSTHQDGNSIELYELGHLEKRLYRDDLYSAHGVVWMEKDKRLYALGKKELRAYSLADWETNSPRLKLEDRWETPLNGGHDLVKASDCELILTAHDGVYRFDTRTEDFIPFKPLKNRKNVKSINYQPQTGRLIYTQAEVNWWTHNIYMENPKKVLTIDDIDLYKVRVIDND